jgi:hypothetical protein
LHGFHPPWQNVLIQTNGLLIMTLKQTLRIQPLRPANSSCYRGRPHDDEIN